MAIMYARDGREAYVVDLRIRTPNRASGNGNLEFARKIVERRITREHLAGFERQR